MKKKLKRVLLIAGIILIASCVLYFKGNPIGNQLAVIEVQRYLDNNGYDSYVAKSTEYTYAYPGSEESGLGPFHSYYTIYIEDENGKFMNVVMKQSILDNNYQTSFEESLHKMQNSNV